MKGPGAVNAHRKPSALCILTDLGGTGDLCHISANPILQGLRRWAQKSIVCPQHLHMCWHAWDPPGQEPPKDGHLSSTCPTWLCTAGADGHRAGQAIAELKCLLQDGLGPSCLWHSFPSPQPQDGAEGAWFGDGCWVLKFDRRVFESQLCHLLILSKFLNHFSVSFPICIWC